MTKFEEKTLRYQRGMVKELLCQCTESQIEFFERVFGPVDSLPSDRPNQAYGICERTLMKNSNE